MSAYTLVTDEEGEQFALYENGALVENGDINDGIFEMLHNRLGWEWMHIEDMFLGDDDRSDPPRDLRELTEYENMPSYEKEARELEVRARQIRERGKQRGY